MSMFSTVGVAVLLGFGAAFGQEGSGNAPDRSGPPSGRPAPKVSAEVLKAYDKDNDGKLSKEERAAMRADVQAAMKKYDADADGKLSEAELAKAKAENPTLAGMLGMSNAPKEGRGDFAPNADRAQGGPNIPEAVLKLYDKDGDGKLSKEERAAMRADVQAAIKKYDADGNGKLSEAELAKAKAENPALASMLTHPAKGKPGPGDRPQKERKGKPEKQATSDDA